MYKCHNGLRPGEKPHETLTFPEEELARTPHPKIDKAIHELELPGDFQARVEELILAARREDEDRVRVLLSELVPSYRPSVPRGRFFIERDEVEEDGEAGQVLKFDTPGRMA